MECNILRMMQIWLGTLYYSYVAPQYAGISDTPNVFLILSGAPANNINVTLLDTPPENKHGISKLMVCTLHFFFKKSVTFPGGMSVFVAACHFLCRFPLSTVCLTKSTMHILAVHILRLDTKNLGSIP